MILFALPYLVFLLAIVVAAGFIVFHLLRYSIDQTIARRTVACFIIITVILVIVNLFFFLQIPLESIAPLQTQNSSFGSPF